MSTHSFHENEKIDSLAEKIFKRLTTLPGEEGFEGDSLSISRDWEGYSMYSWEKEDAIAAIKEVLRENV